MASIFVFNLLLLAIFSTTIPSSLSQNADAPSLALTSDSCNGIFLSYAYTSGKKLTQILSPVGHVNPTDSSQL